LQERANGDCVFWHREKGCTIYPVRPPQCRSWPFWDSNVATPEDWDRTCQICPGAGQGEVIPVEEITRRLKLIKI
jgi:Fe-S-cluster containining protein